MRHAAAFLLLLLLPGLLLPAGMLLHVCRCATLVRPEARSCCRHEPAPDATQTASCCHRHDAPQAPHDGLPRAGAQDCGCVWLPLPETREEPARPDLPYALPDSTASTAAIVAELSWSPQSEPRRWRAADSRPPPPAHERNLPLRL